MEEIVKVLENCELVLVSAGNDFRIVSQKAYEKWKQRGKLVVVKEGTHYKIYQSEDTEDIWVCLSDPHGMAELLFCMSNTSSSRW